MLTLHREGRFGPTREMEGYFHSGMYERVRLRRNAFKNSSFAMRIYVTGSRHKLTYTSLRRSPLPFSFLPPPAQQIPKAKSKITSCA